MNALVLVLLAQLALEPIYEPAGPLPSRVVLVVDRSVSMAPVATASLNLARSVVEQATDELDVAAYVFGADYSGHTWVSLPDAEASARLTLWIEQAPVGDLDTLPSAPLSAALRLQPLRAGPVAVLLVTDGDWTTTEFEECKRTVAGRPPGRSVGVLLVGAFPGAERVAELGRLGGAGAWRLKVPE